MLFQVVSVEVTTIVRTRTNAYASDSKESVTLINARTVAPISIKNIKRPFLRKVSLRVFART